MLIKQLTHHAYVLSLPTPMFVFVCLSTRHLQNRCS